MKFYDVDGTKGVTGVSTAILPQNLLRSQKEALKKVEIVN